ncbi:MAG: agmatine deiminase family protein [Chitinophagales bacterium]|nr:agmatine deiminase family protein [Chitinophagales bacterium]
MKKIYYILFCLLAFSPRAHSQDDPLPRGLSVVEQLLLSQRKPAAPPPGFGIVDPPSSPIRAMAEWEELQALVVTWRSQKAILAQIINAAKQECKVVVACTDIPTCQNELSNYGVDWSQNVDFLQAPSNSIWVRDYGGSPCYLNDVDSLVWVDWIYNRPRPLDDVMPELFGQYFDMPVYTTTTAPNDLVHTGGNFMTDGLGLGFSSNLVLEENDSTNNWGISNHSVAEVEEIMDAYMNVSPYAKMTILPYDGIHHIDMHIKLLDEVTLLVGQYPPGVADGPQIEANLQYVLNNFTTSYGTPFKVIRVPMPPDDTNTYPDQGGSYRTYANAVFVNKTIIVPTYEEHYDTTGLRIWREAMPGYKIVGVNCDAMIYLGGAVHCITKEVGVGDPLVINHRRLDDISDANPTAYEVQASIRHKSGIAEASLFYKTDLSAPYQELALTLSDPGENIWKTAIPQQPTGTMIYYYIHATANSGKQIARPMPAPEGYFRFRINGFSSTVDLSASAVKFGEMFPNPASALTCVPVYSQVNTEANIFLSDCLGRKIQTVFSGTLATGESKHFFNAEGLPDGVYFMFLQTRNAQELQKIVIHH